MVPVVSACRGRDLWDMRRRGLPAGRGGTRQHDHARGTDRLDDHDHQPRRARRHRVDTDHQLSGSRDHRRQQDRHAARCTSMARVVPRQIMNLSSSFDHRVDRRRRRRGVHPTDQGAAGDTGASVPRPDRPAWHAGAPMSVAAPTLTGTHVQLEQLSRRFRRRAGRSRQRRPLDVRLDASATDRRGHAALHQRLARRPAGAQRRAVRPAPCQRRRPRRLHALPATRMVGRPTPCPTRSRSAARGWPPRRSARRSTPRPSTCCCAMRSRRGTCTACRSAPTPATRRAELRSCASAPRSRASCAATAARTPPGEENIVARDSAMYSVIRSEWPAVKRGLEDRLAMTGRRIISR